MGNQIWIQDDFTKGELSPYTYGRGDLEQYGDGLKTAVNCISYPTGSTGKRFGTLYRSTSTNMTVFNEAYFQTFHYLNQCVYQLLFLPDKIEIYMEGLLIATVTGTGMDANQCYEIDSTVLRNAFRVCAPNFRPKDLIRSPNSFITMEGFPASGGTLFGDGEFAVDVILPATFTAAGPFPVTVPQLRPLLIYFVRRATNDPDDFHFQIFTSVNDAKLRINALKYISGGPDAGLHLIIQNTWTFTNPVFSEYPVYDFNQNYDLLSFSVASASGTTTLYSNGNIFTAEMVGGAFLGAGGAARIFEVTSPVHAGIYIQKNFDASAVGTDGNKLSGRLSLLAEPAWSDLRGWPSKCSSYQNRAIFGNTNLLENGIWLSTINDYSSFNDLESDDDDAISWYPTSDQVNVIQFILPYRSLTVYTNSGAYSTSLGLDVAITPSNFSLQLQDNTPPPILHPRAIDNQIIVVCGNDVYSLVWSGINNAYTSSLVSIANEQLIRSPVDEAVFYDFNRAGSRYVFIVNGDGTLAIFQTLLSEDISGFTAGTMTQSYGTAKFLQVASDFDGRCWFLVEREVLGDEVNLAFSIQINLTVIEFEPDNVLIDTISSGVFVTQGPAVGPTTIPQVTEEVPFYWARRIADKQFSFYLTKEDADSDLNRIIFSQPGSGWLFAVFPLTKKFFIEELSFDVFTDCTVIYSGTSTSIVSMPANLFREMELKAVGDGFGFEGVCNISNQFDFVQHGELIEITNASIGFGIDTIIEPMPLSMATGKSQNFLTRPKHIRNVNLMFNNTIGGTVNGVPIALNKFNQANIGEPPAYSRGIFELSVLHGWEDFNNPTFRIEHSDPFNIELLGLFYDVDV